MVEGIPVGSIEAIGHRIVHGGTRFTAPTLVDDEVLDELDGLAGLAPLHNPVAVGDDPGGAGGTPGVPEVAAFDTAFHATLAPPAFTYPLPASVDRSARPAPARLPWAVGGMGPARAAVLLATPSSDLALVVAHLGSGCSVTAVDAGQPGLDVHGHEPARGPDDGTRSGSIDPGILVRLLRAGVTPDQLVEGLEHESGLLGVAGSADMRELLEREASGDERAALAIELFVRRAAEGIAAAATALPRLTASCLPAGSASTRRRSARGSSVAWGCWAWPRRLPIWRGRATPSWPPVERVRRPPRRRAGGSGHRRGDSPSARLTFGARASSASPGRRTASIVAFRLPIGVGGAPDNL